MEENNFKNVYENSSKTKHNFKNSVVVPFLSGALGCTLVIGTCFGIPEIRQKLIGSSDSVSTASTEVNKNIGTVDFVSLESYSDTAVYAANKILPSIVGIEVTYDVTTNSMFSIWGGSERTFTSETTASGSGIIISEDGYILTNNHVVSSSSSNEYYEISEAKSVKVKLYNDDTEYEAKIIGKDSQTDLAVLKIEASNITAAEFADSDSIKIGEFAMAVGNPLALGSTITCGVVSAVNRDVEVEVENGKTATFVCIQTDAAINAGNSGGALVNSEGKVIGVNTLKVSSAGVEGIGFSIPINSTTSITSDLIKYSKVRRPYIGIGGRSLSKELAEKHSLVEGIYVVSVDEFSSAEKAGLKIGDVITAVDNETVKTMDELNKIKNTHSIGDTITLTVYRDGQNKNIELKLGEAEN